MNNSYMTALIIEVVGISVTSVGIIYEYLSGEPIGLITITVGSMIIATGSLLYAKVYNRLNKKNKK